MPKHADIPAAAERCLLTLRTLSAAGAVNNALFFCREPWVREAAKRKGCLETELIGVYWIWGADDVTHYPAAVVRVRRVPWKLGQSDRTAFLALYSEGKEWWCVCFDGLIEDRRLSAWPP